MSKASELKAQLEAATKESLELDQQIIQLREKQAVLNAQRKTLEVDFQRENALEEQAKLSGSCS